ncbi:Holliday junction resolvase [Candidatus Woesearchaeota archaeon]|nr:Holliday junction resolvase [Candidatus Woesearchaeota archaeon]
MKLKTKGTKAERELVHLFWANGWAPVRSAGSGSVPIPNPDIIAGNGIRKVAIEAKSSKGSYIYIPKKEVKELERFALLFGAEPWIGARFNNQKWVFIKTHELKQSEKNCVISLKSIKDTGISFEKLISNQ